jgi:branched-chain amino acid transport system permease protein
LTQRQTVGHLLARHQSGLTLLCLWVVIGLAPLVWGNPYTLGLLNLIGVQVIAVLGLNLFIGYAGQISLGHAGFLGLGAYGSAILTGTYGLPPWLTIALVAGCVVVVAFVLGVPTLRLKSHYLAMATLGFNIVVYTVLVQWDRVTGGPSGLSGVPPLSLGRLPLDTDFRFYYLVWPLALIALTLCLNLVRSGVGRGLAALAADEVAAASLGVDVSRAKVGVFVLSAALASLAGSLYAHSYRFVSPESFGIFASLDLVTMVVVGGIGSVWGTLFGVAFVSLMPELLDSFDEYKEIAHGLILLGILLVLPHGLLVGLLDLVRVRSARRRLASQVRA